jgi:hypothetical protein
MANNQKPHGQGTGAPHQSGGLLKLNFQFNFLLFFCNAIFIYRTHLDQAVGSHGRR